MAPSGGRREVPDSEDEPMTSSPVNASDSVADKLSVTARVPVQDTQDTLDTPKEAILLHQATAENVANMPGKRTDGLDADRNFASIDIVISPNDGVEQSSPTISSQQLSTEADNTARPLISNSPLQLELCTLDKGQQNRANSQEETNCETRKPPTTVAATDPDSMPEDTGRINGENAFQSAHARASQELSDRSVISRDERTSHKDDASRTREGTAVEETGATNEILNDITKDEDLQAHTQGPASYKDVKQAFYLLDAPSVSSADLKSQQPTNSAPVISGINEELDLSPKISSNSHNSTTNTSQGTLNLETGTPMGMDASYSTPQTKPQVSVKDCSNTLSFCTDPASSVLTPETNSTQQTSKGSTDMPHPTVPSTPDMRTQPTPNPSTTGAESNSTPQSNTSSQPSSAPPIPTPAKTPQEITLAELKAQKSAMLASLAMLPAIQVLMEENASASAKTSDGEDEPTETDIMAAANKIVKEHIKLLHEYNELKDVGQGLMGLIADQRGVRIVEVQEEFGIEAND